MQHSRLYLTNKFTSIRRLFNKYIGTGASEGTPPFERGKYEQKDKN